MKYILSVALILATMSMPVLATSLSGSAISRSIIVGTLADANNPVEMAAAPEYTRLAVLRQRTTNILLALIEDSSVPKVKLQSAVSISTSIQYEADTARKLLDSTIVTKVMTPDIAATIKAARESISNGENLYDKLRSIINDD